MDFVATLLFSKRIKPFKADNLCFFYFEDKEANAFIDFEDINAKLPQTSNMVVQSVLQDS